MAGIPYKKEIVKPDGRKLVAGGPRDQQRRLKDYQDQASLIEALRLELKEARETPVIKEGFTGEQVDEEIRKAVTEALEDERKKSSVEINNLKQELKEKTEKLNELNGELGVLKEKILSLTDKIKERDDTIAQEIERSKLLLQQLTTTGDDLVIETNRPKMEPVFVDPLEKSAGDKLVPHIKVEDIKNSEKEELQSKVNKLRGLMGQLPNRD